MTKIGAFQLPQLARTRAGAPSRYAGMARTVPGAARAEEGNQAPQSPLGLDPAVIDAIQRLSTDDSERPGQVFKLFLSHALGKELAHHGLSPNAVQVLTDTTWERMSVDPALREEIERAQEHLRMLRASNMRASRS